MEARNKEEICKKINAFEKKLQSTYDNVEKAEISEKIKALRQSLAEFDVDVKDPVIQQNISDPVIADRKSGNIKLSRGQIMNAGDTFTASI